MSNLDAVQLSQPKGTLFGDYPMEWIEHLAPLGWHLAPQRNDTTRPNGHLCRSVTKESPPCREAVARLAETNPEWHLGLIMNEFEHDDKPWHTITICVDGYNHREDLSLWAWSEILGRGVFEMAEGGVCITSDSPEISHNRRFLNVPFRVKGLVPLGGYVTHPTTQEGFSPGETVPPGGWVTAPGSTHPTGGRFAIYRRVDMGWLPTARMLAPSELPELPPHVARRLFTIPATALMSVQQEQSESLPWKGLDAALIRRLFGADPAGATLLLPAFAPNGQPTTEGVRFWRVGEHPAAQVITETKEGRTSVGFLDETLAETFGARATPPEHPNGMYSLHGLLRRVASHLGATREHDNLPGTISALPNSPPLEWSLMETITTPTTFLFANNTFPVGEITAIVGLPKRARKSWFGAELAAAVSTGLPLGGLPNSLSEPRSVLYLTKESPSEQKLRIYHQISRLCMERNQAELISEATDRVKTEEGRFLSPEGDMVDVQIGDGSIRKVLYPWIEKHGTRLVVFDPLGMYLPPDANTNNYKEMLDTVEELLELARETNTSVVYTHHSPKTNQQAQLGSQALEGIVAQTIYMELSKKTSEVSGSIVSRFFVKKPDELIRFVVDPLPGGGGHMRHMGHMQDVGRPGASDTEQRKEWQMMTLLERYISKCHNITRSDLGAVFERVSTTEGQLTTIGQQAESLSDPKSGSLRQFLAVATAQGWLEETGKIGRAHGYKLGACPHQDSLISRPAN